MEIPVTVWSLKSSILRSSSSWMDKTFCGERSAAAEKSRCKANMVSQWDRKFCGIKWLWIERSHYEQVLTSATLSNAVPLVYSTQFLSLSLSLVPLQYLISCRLSITSAQSESSNICAGPPELYADFFRTTFFSITLCLSSLFFRILEACRSV